MNYLQTPNMMNHKQGEDRNQMFMFSLESAIARDSFVRVVDAFVDTIDLKSFGFTHVECKEEGRPPYHPAVLMKLYLYGYRYGIRTTRKLEREAQTNIEAMWLLSGLRPKYKTIADFRKNHSKGFREIFRRFVCLLKEWDLIEGETVAIDSFKIRGNNSLKNNFNDKKLKRHLEYIDSQITEYEALLDSCDKEEDKKEIESKIEERKEKKAKYEQVKKDLESSGEEQVSLTDPDARAVILHRNIINVGYNIQASSDSKHKLLVEYDTGDVNDTHALASIAIKTKDILGVEKMNALADKGYHTGEQLKQCHGNNITTYVSPKAPSTKDIGLYPITMFVYNKDTNTYTCPRGNILYTNGNWYRHSDNRKGGKGAYRFQRYTTADCKTCKSRHLCTQSKINSRCIDRSEYADIIQENAERVEGNPEYYRQRQQVTEHMFGTLKRQRGFTHTLVRGKEKVLGEVGLMFIGYNLGRCISIIGTENLIKMLRESVMSVFLSLIRLILSNLRPAYRIEFI
ncbi:MAG: IS1182 family transposase [Bacteroidetes bacterium]|nr:IS1182 family transposase [Bacteroidota bacterium]